MLAVDWNSRQLRLAYGKTQRDGVSVTKASCVDLPADLDTQNAAALGAFIAQRLREEGISIRQAVSCIERRNIVFKSVELAGVEPDEIADVVRLQVMRELTIPVEEACVDYLMLPTEEDRPPQALLAVVRQPIVDEYKGVLQAAGLTLVGLWPTALAHAALAGRVAAARGLRNCLVLVPDDDLVEMSLVVGGRLLFSVARPMSRGEEDFQLATALTQTVRRLKSALASQYPAINASTMLVCGAPEVFEPICAPWRGMLADEVSTFDPLEDSAALISDDQHAPLASAVGSLRVALLPSDGRFNFLAPKKATAKPDRRRLYAIAAVGALLLGGFRLHAYRGEETERLQGALQRAQQQERKLAAELKRLRTAENRYQLIEQWTENDVVWLDLLDRLHAQMPDKKDLFVTSMRLSPGNRRQSIAAVVRIDGFADSQQTITTAYRRWVEEGGFQVRPGAVQPSNRHSGYPWSFTAELSDPVRDRQTPMESANPGD